MHGAAQVNSYRGGKYITWEHSRNIRLLRISPFFLKSRKAVCKHRGRLFILSWGSVR